jgi:hypothetical protein
LIPLYKGARKLFKKSAPSLAALRANTIELFSKRDLVIIIFFTILGLGGVFAATLVTVTAPDSQGAGYVAATSCDEAVTIDKGVVFNSSTKRFEVTTISISGVDQRYDANGVNGCGGRILELAIPVNGVFTYTSWSIPVSSSSGTFTYGNYGCSVLGSCVSAADNSCPQSVENATGITVTAVSGECVVKFTSTAAATRWRVPSTVTSIKALIVAGGGGGGYDFGGGGGAGGLLYYGNETVKAANGASIAVIPNTDIQVTVGAGGAGGTGYDNIGSVFSATKAGRGANGATSSLDLTVGSYYAKTTLTAIDSIQLDKIAITIYGSSTAPTYSAIGGGGGYTGHSILPATQSGGSGGGGGGTDLNGFQSINGGAGTGTGITLQGYAGGNGYYDTPYFRGSGGGGAGGIGQNASVTPNGGLGLSYSITGTSVGYGGGGGGGSWATNYFGYGGGGAGNLFGGGNGGGTSAGAGVSGAANTGGGGGGSGWASGNPPAGSGGSGIVIIRYTP